MHENAMNDHDGLLVDGAQDPGLWKYRLAWVMDLRLHMLRLQELLTHIK
ncbi:MAG TPA: hypothetical protein VIM63_16465 [Rhodoferax sp.]